MLTSFNPPTFTISEKVWLYSSLSSSWHFVTIPVDISNEIKTNFSYLKAAWGSLPVLVAIGKTSWTTSIFPDKKTGCYLLPIKADVRKTEKILVGNTVSISIQVKI